MPGVIGRTRPDLNPGNEFEEFIGITADRYSKSLYVGLNSDLMVAAITTVNSSGVLDIIVQGSPNRGKDWYDLYSFPQVTTTDKHDFKSFRRGEFYELFRIFVDWGSGDFDVAIHAIPRSRESNRLDLEELPELFSEESGL